MKAFPYADQQIGYKEVVLMAASVMTSIGPLIFPRMLAKATESLDGLISIMLNGCLALVLGWMLGKITAYYPNMNFFEYSGKLITKPVTYMICLLALPIYVTVVAFEIRAIATITKMLMFNQTPIEAITLLFLLVIVYAVSGSRSGLIRLNTLFFLPILSMLVLVLVLDIGKLEMENIEPIFVTSWQGILQGMQVSFIPFIGFNVMLFYSHLMNEPRKMSRALAAGISIPFVLSLVVYFFDVAVFSREGVATMTFPTMELAKTVEIPGGFFERFESLFFTVWIMTIFNTTTIYFDCMLINLGWVFPKPKKIVWVCWLAPVIFIVSMLPQNNVQLERIFTLAGYGALFFAVLPVLYLLLAKFKKSGVKRQ